MAAARSTRVCSKRSEHPALARLSPLHTHRCAQTLAKFETDDPAVAGPQDWPAGTGDCLEHRSPWPHEFCEKARGGVEWAPVTLRHSTANKLLLSIQACVLRCVHSQIVPRCGRQGSRCELARSPQGYTTGVQCSSVSPCRSIIICAVGAALLAAAKVTVMRLAAQAHQIGRHVQAPASTAVCTADSAERPRALQETAAWALQYLLLQLAAVGLAALLQAYLGAPPWTLRYDGEPLVTLSRVSLWTSLVSGVADLLTGELTQNYASAAHAGGYVAIWLATCLVQGICVTLDAVPPLATVLVALGCQVVAVVAHTALADVRQWPYTPTAAYLRAFGTLRWGFAAMLLLATCSPGTISSAPRLLGYVAGVQALWQLFTWAQALHSSVLQVFGLHTVCFLATHAVCVRATWSAAGLGWAHAGVGVYTCWALSAAVCEARFPLPHLAEEVNTRIWCACVPHCCHAVHAFARLHNALTHTHQRAACMPSNRVELVLCSSWTPS